VSSLGTATKSIANWTDARCIGCGYALRGLAEMRCPECGLAFDSSDSSTFNPGRHYGRFVRWLLGRTRWVGFLNSAIFAILIVAQGYFFLPVNVAMFFLVLAWLGLAAPYMFWSIIRRAVVWMYAQPARLLSADRKMRSRIARNALIAAAVIALWPSLALVPFSISRRWLDRYANHLYTEVPMLSPPPTGRWCGWYLVQDCRTEPYGVWMEVNGQQMLYSPSGPPQGGGGEYFTPVGGDWYVVDSQVSIREFVWSWLY
jgi:hypothetical protein